MNDVQAATLSPELIAAVPDSIGQPDDPQDEARDFQNVVLHLRAIDLDNPKRGWGVIAPTIADKRVKMHLDPHIKRDHAI